MSFFPLLYVYATICGVAFIYCCAIALSMHPRRTRWPVWGVAAVMAHYILLSIEAWTVHMGLADIGLWVRFGWVCNGALMLFFVCALVKKYGEDAR